MTLHGLSSVTIGVTREGPVRPRKLAHAVPGSTDPEATRRFFVEGLGFKVPGEIKGQGAFLRCSTDHHNVLVLRRSSCAVWPSRWRAPSALFTPDGSRTIISSAVAPQHLTTAHWPPNGLAEASICFSAALANPLPLSSSPAVSAASAADSSTLARLAPTR